jgi:hypothetical protein
VGIGYNTNIGLKDALSVNGDISANTITVNNLSIKNLIDTVSCINAKSIYTIELNYIVSSTGVYDANGILIVRPAIYNDYNIVGICLQNNPNIVVGITGHTKVWCSSKVTVGDFLAANANGLAYSAGHQVITQNVTANVQQQNYVVKKVVNGVPIFVGQSQSTNTNTNTNTTTTNTTQLISSYTFGKSTTTWDPDNPVSWIPTKYASTGEFVGLIGCIISY